jgi:hypothetical protein
LTGLGISIVRAISAETSGSLRASGGVLTALGSADRGHNIGATVPQARIDTPER